MTTTNQPIGRILLKTYLNEDGSVKHGVRLAFPKLFRAEQVNGQGDPKFGASLIIDLAHPQLADLQKAQEAVAKEKWKEKAASVLKVLEKQDRLAIHDGDMKAQYDGFPGNFYLSANAQESAPPTVVDRDRSELTERSGRPYAGCYVNASLEIWAQDNKFGQRVNTTLRGIQFYKDGDSFSAGRPADANEFEDATEGSDAEDFA